MTAISDASPSGIWASVIIRCIDKLRTDGRAEDRPQLVAAGAVIVSNLPEIFPADVDFAAYVEMA